MYSPMSSAYHTIPSHPGSPAQSANYPSLQTIASPSCQRPVLQMIHPVAVEVLQRVEAQSTLDVESLVRAMGDKRYAVVKENRRAALLRRARDEQGVTELDDATVRRHTNLASAEASRAKKEFILDQLHSQLKMKSEDAIVLAKELRRVLTFVEELSATNQRLELQLNQQRFAFDPFACSQVPMQGQVFSGQETISRFGITDPSKCEPSPASEDQFFSAVSHEMGDDEHITEYSPVMDPADTQATQATATVTTTNSNAETLVNDQQADVIPSFDVDYNLKMEALICQSSGTPSYEVSDEKMNALQKNVPSGQAEVTDTLPLSASTSHNYNAGTAHTWVHPTT